MTELISGGIYLANGREIIQKNDERIPSLLKENQIPGSDEARQNSIGYQILLKHNLSGSSKKLKIGFDALISHDITYVGIIQSARVSGMTAFPLPYALTNCHNSLSAVGGTINEDDHVFGLSAAKKYGGIYVPANMAVIHQYAREMMSGCGKMILGSDSHTRYGALGTLAIGEGGPDLVKQLLQKSYDIDAPEVILVYLENEPRPGVGPHDVAIKMVKELFPNGFAKNKILEFAGPGIKNLSMDFRNGIDVMTTETTCLSSIWETDEVVQSYYAMHGRPEDYQKLQAGKLAYYDALFRIDLSEIEPMIALPFHPSNAYTIRELLENPADILHTVELESAKIFGKEHALRLREKINHGYILVDQGIIAGCAGGMFDNICEATDILESGAIGTDYFSLSVYPASMPINAALTNNGVFYRLQKAGAVTKMPFCGPCFGAGDVPANNALSIRHTTRNFPNREGSKPEQGQGTGVALMDARSIAATAANGGYLTPATDWDIPYKKYPYSFDREIYTNRVYYGFRNPESNVDLRLGPNITDWPKMYPLSENLILVISAIIRDAVTTTDELIPSGETSSYRSNPLKLAEFTLSRRVPEYVSNAKAIRDQELNRLAGNEIAAYGDLINLSTNNAKWQNTAIGSVLFANKPGDGSAREQAASSQRVLGAVANIAYEYATKRYRSNCINWGMIPFTIDKNEPFDFNPGDAILIENIREHIIEGSQLIPAKVKTKSGVRELTLYCSGLSDEEKGIILSGSLMNYYADLNKENQGK